MTDQEQAALAEARKKWIQSLMLPGRSSITDFDTARIAYEAGWRAALAWRQKESEGKGA